MEMEIVEPVVVQEGRGKGHGRTCFSSVGGGDEEAEEIEGGEGRGFACGEEEEGWGGGADGGISRSATTSLEARSASR
eukprot:768526-Hanusia_phi.AAC.2